MAELLPGDDVLPRADPVMDRHLDLSAGVDVAWPWVEQLGKGRAGWYLPRSVERVVPSARRAARGVEPRWRLEVGEAVPDWGPGDPTFEVLAIERPRHLVYWSERPRRPRRGVQRPPMRMTWALVLSPAGQDRSHLHLRLRLDLGRPAGPLATYGGGAVDWLTVALMGRGLDERLRATR
ncbi:MAG: hypothetical protein ABIQ59_08825 [Nocardioidaceae bacterium]